MTNTHIEHSLTAEDWRQEGEDTLAACEVVADLTINGAAFKCIFQNDGDGVLTFSNHPAGLDEQTEAIAEALGIEEEPSIVSARPLDDQVARALESVCAEAQRLFDSKFVKL